MEENKDKIKIEKFPDVINKKGKKVGGYLVYLPDNIFNNDCDYYCVHFFTPNKWEVDFSKMDGAHDSMCYDLWFCKYK